MLASRFLQQLTSAVQEALTTVETEWAALPDAMLNAQPGYGRWSALECLEHLNRYCRYYNPALARALARPGSTAGEVSYSWLGRKSLEVVRPANAQAHKTLQRMNPTGSQLQRAVASEFVRHQQELLHLLDQAQAADLNRRAVPVEFFRLLKLRTGEAVEFVVLHQQRHLQQAERAIRQATLAASPAA